MTRIKKKFYSLAAKGCKALIPFFFAGDPGLDTTYELVLAAEREGADIIELGIPYSDPLADGPVNQEAAARALKNKIRLDDIIGTVKRLRKVTDIPIAFLLYFNCMMQYGVEKFLSACQSAGVDGLVVPDLPYEERESYQDVFNKFDIDIISMVTPTSGERIKKIVQSSSGFVYCVTSSGVTGVRKEFDTDFAAFMSDVAKYTDTPRVLGFGISTPGQVKKLKDFAEGIIVGSAIVKLMNDTADSKKMVGEVSRFIGSLKRALDD